MKHRNRWSAVLVALVVGLASGRSAAENVDPDNDGSQYAWAENVGWINAEAGGDGGAGMQVSDFALIGWMWSENAGWISLSCENSASCDTATFGVKNDGNGSLSGLAWGENVGWVNFAPTNAGVAINPSSGELTGRAWGENVGWISFSCADGGTCASADYGVKTGWCQTTGSTPTGGPTIHVERSGADVKVSGLTLAGGANWHELVRGSLSVLRASGGDFASATLECAGDNVTGGTVLASGAPQPAVGDGYWYLARPVNCRGKGTFNLGAHQVGSRDAEIAASGVGCP